MTTAWESLTNHLTPPRGCCCASHDRYCATGRELWLDDRVRAIADTAGIEERRYLLEQEARNNPMWLGEIKRRVAERFEANRRKAA